METLIKSENRNPKQIQMMQKANLKTTVPAGASQSCRLPPARGSPSRSAFDERGLSAEPGAGRSLKVLRLGEPRAGGVATLRPASPIAILRFPIYFGFST